MAKSPKTKTYPNVPADPVKSFFVHMLTRDISLEYAIFDLLDNCVDGILRQKKGRIGGKTPYRKHFANIDYDGKKFQIADNCGGIPWSLHEYAFRMGRADPGRKANMPTVGVYGIGMKRAVFKIGRNCLIQTRHGSDAYDVEISPQWLGTEDDWAIPVRPSKSRMKQDGTCIIISDLNDDVRSLLGDDREFFDKEFRDKIATHYAFIINKGLQIKVNGELIGPKQTELRFEEGRGTIGIRPFLYTTSVDDVDVFLAVGFTRPIPSEEDVAAEQERKQYSSLGAGWTVVCNDRAVVYCDRTELTGWGEAGVPQYHTQFTAISGIVEFRSDDASKLPTTTTKRGINASSRLYLQVKNKMREGLRMFTDFTNKWKGRERAQQAQDRIRSASPKSLQDLKVVAESLALSSVSSGARGKQYKPHLPMPPKEQKRQDRITFVRDKTDVQDVAEFLFGDTDVIPSEVGGKCFDVTLDRVRT